MSAIHAKFRCFVTGLIQRGYVDHAISKMAASMSSSKVLSLYKSMLKESQKFTGYNYRMYALRRVKDAFRENKAESDVEKIRLLIAKGEHNLGLIKRQAVISQLYAEPKLVIEQSTASPS